MPSWIPDWQFYKDVGNRLWDGATSPDLYTGAAKEATIGLMGLPGDIGYMAGNAPGVVENWNEGRPLLENTGRLEDYPMTSDWIAKKMGVPFTGSGEETAGRVLGGLVSVPGVGRQIAKGARYVGEGIENAQRAPGTRAASQRGGPWYEDVPAKFAVPTKTTDVVMNPTRGELDDMLDISTLDQKTDLAPYSSAGEVHARMIRDPAGNVYVAPGQDILHNQIAEQAGLPEGYYERGEIVSDAARWFDETDWNDLNATDFNPADIIEQTRPLREQGSSNPRMDGLLGGPGGKQRGAVSLGGDINDPRIAKAKEQHTDLLSRTNEGGEVSTRVPTSKKLDPDAPHQTNEMLLNEEVVKSDPNYVKAAAKELRAREMTPDWAKELNDEGLIDYQLDLETKNLTDLYNDMDPALAEQSTFWYPGANIHNQEIASQFGISNENVAAVQAVLSPKTRWDINVEMGDRLIDTLSTKQNEPWSPEMTNRINEFEYSPVVKDAVQKVMGKSLAELEGDPVGQAIWVRVYDETHRPQEFRELAPDGRKLGIAKNKKGDKPLAFGWQTLGNITKAINAYNAKGMEDISRLLGENHKVRSFFNNMSNPKSELGQITSDTHHVNAALMQPMGLKDPKVLKNFGGVSSNMTGLKGLYPVHAAAAQRTAEGLNIKPREVQSATWEHIRSVWPDEIKAGLAEPIAENWNKYGRGLLSRKDAFEMSLEQAAKKRAEKGLLGVPIWTDK